MNIFANMFDRELTSGIYINNNLINKWISTVIVTLVIIQFIKGNTLMVLECLLETENGVNFNRQTDRLTWCNSIGSF